MRWIGGMSVPCLVLVAAACSAGPAPAQTGAVETARELREACGGADDKSACYDARLGEIAKTGDVRRALDVVAALAERDDDVARDGHMYVHAVGIAAYDPAGDFAETFTRCTELFHAGCYHGLIQAHFSAVGQVDAETVNRLCDEVSNSGADRWTTFQCLHGIGHGLVIHSDHDLIEGLKGCDLLDDPWKRASCEGGAFMENVTNATHPHHAALTESLGASVAHADHGAMSADAHANHDAAAAEPFAPIDPEDPHYPCSIVEEHQKLSCYGMQTSVMLYLTDYDFGKAAELCDGAPATYVAACHQSLGRDASGFSNRNADELNRLCAQDRSRYASFCYVGAAKAVIDWAGQPEDGLAFCRSVQGDDNRIRCYQAVGQQIGVIVPDEARGRALCAEADGAEEQACLFGATLVADMPPELRSLMERNG